MSTSQLRGLRAALVALSLTAVAGVAGAQPVPVRKDSGAAQPPAGQGGMAERQRQMQAMMFEGITLTAAQQKSIDSIRTAFQEKRQAAPREERGALMQQQNDAFRGLLTDEQKKVFDANMEKVRANMPRRPNGR
jgi:Spy/CpxP family protein refolding chaperone